MSNSNAFRVRKALQVNDNDLFVSGGRVGIGTTEPSSTYTLHCTSEETTQALFEHNGTGVSVKLKDSNADVQFIYIGSNDTLTITSNVNLTGNLDIPDRIRHTGDADTQIRFPELNTVTIETANNERLRVTSTGNVGIGKTNPSEDLDVNGTIIASSYKSSDGSVGITKQISIEDNSGNTHVFNFKNGLLVSHVIDQ